jgi:hypothetical protein
VDERLNLDDDAMLDWAEDTITDIIGRNTFGFVNDLERQVAAPGNTYTAQRVALWTYEALGRQPPAGLMRVADGPTEALARGRYIRDPEAFADELAIIARDIAAAAVDFDDRSNELEDVPELNLDGDYGYSDDDYQD